MIITRQKYSRVVADGEFVAGVLVDVGGVDAQFLPGQLFGLADSEDSVKFVAGQMEDGTLNFVPGQPMDGVFYPGTSAKCSLSVFGTIERNLTDKF